MLFKGSFVSLVGFLVFGVLSVGLGLFVWWWSFAAALVFSLLPLRGSVGSSPCGGHRFFLDVFYRHLPGFYRRLRVFYRHIVAFFLAYFRFFLYLCTILIKLKVMITFDSLLTCEGVCSVPVVSGSLVCWSAAGSCWRVPASFDSLSSVLRELASWASVSDSCVSVSFWCGPVLVARCWGSFALALGVCSLSSCWSPVSFVS